MRIHILYDRIVYKGSKLYFWLVEGLEELSAFVDSIVEGLLLLLPLRLLLPVPHLPLHSIHYDVQSTHTLMFAIAWVLIQRQRVEDVLLAKESKKVNYKISFFA